MLGKLLTPFTTPSTIGVAVRYLTTIATALVALLGLLGLMTPEQVEAITKQVPEVLTAVTTIATVLVPLYAVLTKARSTRADGAAKVIDAKIPPEQPVTIKTPAGVPDIVVSTDGRAVK